MPPFPTGGTEHATPFFASAVVVAALIASPAAAQQLCGPYDEVMAQLQKSYGEQVVVQGLSATGKLMQLAINPESGTWTTLHLTRAGDGANVCAVDAGEGIRFVDPKPTGQTL